MLKRGNYPSITIAIPAYNEEENIDWTIRDSLEDLPRYFENYEILVVDDGSRDKTGKISDIWAKKDKHIRVIHQFNMGFNQAVATGINNAKKDFVAYLPADGQYFVRDLDQMFPLMYKSDLVLGYRGIRQDYNLYRQILSYGYLILLWMAFGITVKDLNGPTIWRTKEAKKLKTIYSVKSKGVSILAEIVTRFKRKGLRITEAPSIYRSRMGGTVKNAKLSVAWDTFKDTIYLWVRQNLSLIAKSE